MTILSSFLAACSGGRPPHLGSHQGRLAACPSSPNCVSSQSEEKGQYVAPLTGPGDPQQLWAHLQDILSRRHDTVMVQQDPDYIRVEFHTTFFIDDGEFLLDAPQGRIHCRSASRLGYSDLGKNRQRLEEIRHALAETDNE